MEPTLYFEQSQLSRTVRHLLADTRVEVCEQRAHSRQPFFGPVTIAVQENGEQRSYSCFSRDISPAGIGLLHNMPLECGEVTVTVVRDSGEVRFRGEVVWCNACGEGWYSSGVRFTGTA